MSVTSVKYYDIDRVLSRMAMYSRGNDGRESLLPNLSPSNQTRLERMRDYSTALSARSTHRPATQLSTIHSVSPRSPVPSIFKSRKQKKNPKSMSTEILCNPCTRDNLHHEASGYCIECSEYFCETCIKHHKNLKITKNHTMQDRRKMPKTKKFIPDEETIEICELHPSELVRYFCKDHDEPSCGICATLRHRACEEVVYIPEIKSKETNKTLVNTIKHMNALTSQFEKAKGDTEKNLQVLDMQRSDYQQKILKLHQDILDHVHHIEREAVVNMDSLYDNERGYLVNRAEACKEAITSLHQATNQLDSAKKNGIESQVFLHMKKVTKQVSSYEQLLTDIGKKNTSALQFKFKADAKVRDFMKKTEQLGSVQISQKPLRTITLLTQFKVNSWSDTYPECNITGLCVLEDGRIVLADRHNENLKVVDSNFQMITQTKLSNAPWGICVISKDQVLVTLPKEKKLQFLMISSTIHPLRKIGNVPSIKSSQYYGVDYFQDRLYVTCPKDDPPNVKILDMQGNQLHQVMAINEEQNLFSSPLYIAVKNNGKIIYVSDSGSPAIAALELKKDTVETTVFEVPDENPPGGLCVLVEGDIYLCGTNTNSVIHLSPEGKFNVDAIGSEGGLLHPQCIGYCAQWKRLIVTMQNSPTVKVFQLS